MVHPNQEPSLQNTQKNSSHNRSIISLQDMVNIVDIYLHISFSKYMFTILTTISSLVVALPIQNMDVEYALHQTVNILLHRSQYVYHKVCIVPHIAFIPMINHCIITY